MAQINPRTFADAQQLGDGVYEVILTNWGNRAFPAAGPDPDNGSIQYPPVKNLPGGGTPIEGQLLAIPIPSLAGIAISPRSNVDRCILHFSSLPQTQPEVAQPQPVSQSPFAPATFNTGFVNRGGILDTEQFLAVGAPLVGQINGPIIIRADPAHWFSNEYLPLGVTVPVPFGTALPIHGGFAGQPVWINPELRLLLFLNSRSGQPPLIRAPFHHSYEFVPSVGTEVLTRVVPIMGRRNITVSLRNRLLLSGDATVRITGTFNVITATSPAPWGVVNNFEVDLSGSLTVPAGQSVVFQICHPGLSFLLIKMTGGAIALDVSVDAD
jgi:hypothetical protein